MTQYPAAVSLPSVRRHDVKTVSPVTPAAQGLFPTVDGRVVVYVSTTSLAHDDEDRGVIYVPSSCSSIRRTRSAACLRAGDSLAVVARVRERMPVNEREDGGCDCEAVVTAARRRHASVGGVTSRFAAGGSEGMGGGGWRENGGLTLRGCSSYADMGSQLSFDLKQSEGGIVGCSSFNNLDCTDCVSPRVSTNSLASAVDWGDDVIDSPTCDPPKLLPVDRENIKQLPADRTKVTEAPTVRDDPLLCLPGIKAPVTKPTVVLDFVAIDIHRPQARSTLTEKLYTDSTSQIRSEVTDDLFLSAEAVACPTERSSPSACVVTSSVDGGSTLSGHVNGASISLDRPPPGRSKPGSGVSVPSQVTGGRDEMEANGRPRQREINSFATNNFFTTGSRTTENFGKIVDEPGNGKDLSCTTVTSVDDTMSGRKSSESRGRVSRCLARTKCLQWLSSLDEVD